MVLRWRRRNGEEKRFSVILKSLLFVYKDRYEVWKCIFKEFFYIYCILDLWVDKNFFLDVFN